VRRGERLGDGVVAGGKSRIFSQHLQHEERREVGDGRRAVAATGRDDRGERLGMEYRAPTRLCLGPYASLLGSVPDISSHEPCRAAKRQEKIGH
jgi:hypothetical protein